MGGHDKTYFEQQREALLGEIAMVSYFSSSYENKVLTNNRALSMF